MTGTEEQETWIGVSDLMAGIAIVFIAFVSYALNDRIESINSQFCEILRESREDLSESGILVESCTEGRVNLVFNDEKTKFEAGEDKIPDDLKKALNQTIPKAFDKIEEKNLDGYIESFVVEGHTSEEWRGKNESDAYWCNMELSQDRARNVLEYIREDIMKLKMKEKERFCNMRRIGSASGLSSRNLVARGNEINQVKSRRIEIVILTQERPEKPKSNQDAVAKICDKEWAFTVSRQGGPLRPQMARCKAQR